MKTKLTVLCENSVHVPFPFIGEHGFSCVIEGEDATSSTPARASGS